MVLLVVDFQKALTQDEELYDSEAFIERVLELIETARKSRTEVIFMQHDAGPESGFSEGDPGFELDGRVKVLENEKVFTKTINSCFGNRDFAAYMNSLKDKRLMIAGLQTDWCIDATVKSAFERGFSVIVPEGTNSTFDNDYMTAETSCRYYNGEIWPGSFADCVSFEEALEMLEDEKK